MVGKAFGSAMPLVGSRGRAGWAGKEGQPWGFCQVNAQLPWTPEEEVGMGTFELGTLTVPPDSLGASWGREVRPQSCLGAQTGGCPGIG